MCLTCGCGSDHVRLSLPEPHDRRQGHEHGERHRDHHEDQHRDHRDDRDGERETLVLEERLLAKNDHLAEHVRAWLGIRRMTAVNLMSSPGSGKTSLLERTIAERGGPIHVIEGDQETAVDAERITRAGARAIQVNTGSGCHLDADMVGRAVRALDPGDGGAALRRERRQPGVPGALRRRRARPGRGHLGHRGRRQAA